MSEAERRMALVAARHYLDGRSRIEIADELGISRFAVARLIEQARDRGVVRFEIVSPDDLDLELSARLRAALGLRHALVIHSPHGASGSLQQRLGTAAARLLEEIMSAGEVLGLAAGRTLHQMVTALDTLPQVDVVQLEGVAAGLQESGVDLVRRAAQVSGGTPHALLAPLFTRTDESAALLRDEPSIRHTLNRFSDVTTAVIGIGSWNPPDSQVEMLAAQLGIRDALVQAGVRADVGAILLDEAGTEIGAVSGRRIGIGETALRAVPHVLAVAGGRRKTAAIKTALRSGLIHSLATDAETATALLDDDFSAEASARGRSRREAEPPASPAPSLRPTTK